MTDVDLVQLLSVLIEIIIAAGAVFIAVKKQKRSGWAIAVTFALFVCFDISRMGMIPSIAVIDGFVFLAANIAMLIAIWFLIQEK